MIWVLWGVIIIFQQLFPTYLSWKTMKNSGPLGGSSRNGSGRAMSGTMKRRNPYASSASSSGSFGNLPVTPSAAAAVGPGAALTSPAAAAAAASPAAPVSSLAYSRSIYREANAGTGIHNGGISGGNSRGEVGVSDHDYDHHVVPSHLSHPLQPASQEAADESQYYESQNDHLLQKNQRTRRRLDQPRGLVESAVVDLIRQGRRILLLLAGAGQPKSLSLDDEDDHFYREDTQKAIGQLYNRILILIPLLLAIVYSGPTSLDWATRPKTWKWNQDRNLNGRRCVMNLYIEKQAPDEFNPDFVEIKPGEKNKDGTLKIQKPPEIINGTYRTKEQIHVISRFIEAVADSFRSNINLRQHVIFAGIRDSGHLAEESQNHWPPRGSFRTQFHVIADDITPDETEEALGYGTIDAIEERFRGKENVHIYDREGNIAGLKANDADDDDDGVMDDDFREGYADRKNRVDRRRAQALGENDDIFASRRPYMSLTSLLPINEDEDEDDDESKHNEEDEDGNKEPPAGLIIPYLHVDGIDQVEQFSILDSAKPLLLTNTIVIVGIEHSPDLDLRALIDFFRSVNYKTFFLGARQIHRVDNLCPEILDDVMEHPSLHKRSFSPGWFRQALYQLGVVKDNLAHMKKLPDDSRVAMPPFFVAMPRGRRNKEEMTIQHMYDLFGGYGGGGGQIKTANDRKAPGKKKSF